MVSRRRRSSQLLIALSLLALVAQGARADGGAAADYDVVVVGSGPGGLVAALSAVQKLREMPAVARSGRAPRVLVVEKRADLPNSARFADRAALAGTAFSRQQILGVKPETMQMLRELGVNIGEEFRGEVREIAAPSRRIGRSGAGPQQTGVVLETYTIQLNELQARLTDACRAKGVEFRFESSLSDLQQRNDDRVDIALEGRGGARQSIRSRWIIGADGAGSRVRSLSGIKLAEPEPQGVMVGVWFKGVQGGNRILHRQKDAPGRSGVILGERQQMYGLFALPPSLGDMVKKAQAARTPLTKLQQARLIRHAEGIAREFLPAREARALEAEHIQPFEVSLNRSMSAVSYHNKALLVGDAMRTVNPYTGSGANKAMLDGDAAARAILAFEKAPTRRGGERVLRQFNKSVNFRSREVHAASRDYAYTFGSPAQARPRRSAKPDRRWFGSPLRTRVPARSRRPVAPEHAGSSVSARRPPAPVRRAR
jgi:2-polyprenyl-6-methoxyphenol hydroxylase-like FAD-dependent oxidoreductase